MATTLTWTWEGGKPMALGYYGNKERMEVADYLYKDQKFMNRFADVKAKEYSKTMYNDPPRRAHGIRG